MLNIAAVKASFSKTINVQTLARWYLMRMVQTFTIPRMCICICDALSWLVRCWTS